MSRRALRTLQAISTALAHAIMQADGKAKMSEPTLISSERRALQSIHEDDAVD